MDDLFSLIFFLWLAIAVVGNIFNKAKRLPPPTNQDLDQIQQNSEPAAFEIPTLANDPNIPVEPLPSREVVEVNQVSNVEDIFRQRQEMYKQRLNQANSRIEPKVEEQVKIQPKQKSNLPLNLNLTPEDTMNAMILSEIFNKPKSLRGR